MSTPESEAPMFLLIVGFTALFISTVWGVVTANPWVLGAWGAVIGGGCARDVWRLWRARRSK